MAEKINRIETIAEYNKIFGVETLHPLVSVINMSESAPLRHAMHNFDFYVVFLKDVKCGDLVYGRQKYDYQEGTVVSIAPGQVAGVPDDGSMFQPRGWALCFHPDLIKGTSLGARIHEYSYFSYAANEALHLSQKEREIFLDCLDHIRHELQHDIDRMSKRLIANNIELLLDYCLRFYERQFITRENVNNDILVRFERLLQDYCHSARIRDEGMPNVKLCARELCLSPNYFGDLIKRETGATAQEYIQKYIIGLAKERLHDPMLSIAQISYQLGFQYPQHFTRLFKRVMGKTPAQYRSAIG